MAGSRVSVGLSQLPEGVPPELFNHFYQLYNAVHNLGRQLAQFAGVDQYDPSLWSQLTPDDSIYDGNLNRWYVKADEPIAFGQVVSPFVTAGELRVRLANATNNTRWACGISSTLDLVNPGSYLEVIVGHGIISGISGMIAGQRYWLSTVNGAIANGPAVAAGNIEQYVGWALSPTRLLMSINGNFIQH